MRLIACRSCSRKTAASSMRPSAMPRARRMATFSSRRRARRLRFVAMRATSPNTIRMRFAGSRGAQSMLGEDVVEATSNYYIGDDATTWHADVPHFQRVRARAVYPGIDVVYYGSGPAARILFRGRAARGSGPHRSVLQRRRHDRDRPRRRSRAAHETCNDHARETGRVSPDRGRATRRRSPLREARRGPCRHQHSHATTARNRSSSIRWSCCTRRISAAAAPTRCSASPPIRTATRMSPGSRNRSIFRPLNASRPDSGGATDVFIAKINAAGTALIYSTYLGGNAIDAALGIARDTSGNVYVTGYTASSEFPGHARIHCRRASNGGAYDAFVAKLGPTGALQYSTYLGGIGHRRRECDRGRWRGQRVCRRLHLFAGFPDRERVPAASERRAEWMLRRQDAFVSKLDTGGTASSTRLISAVRTRTRRRHRGRQPGTRLDHGLHLVRRSSDRRRTAVGVERFGRRIREPLHRDGCSRLFDLLRRRRLRRRRSRIAVDAEGSLYVTGFTQSADFPTVNAFQNDAARRRRRLRRQARDPRPVHHRARRFFTHRISAAATMRWATRSRSTATAMRT